MYVYSIYILYILWFNSMTVVAIFLPRNFESESNET